MAALNRWLKPLTSAVTAFFQHDLALRRDEAGLRLVLEPSRSKQGHGNALNDERLSAVRREELALILRELAQVLDEQPETRAALRQLCLVEKALKRKGLRALDKLPIESLRRALDQFEALVTNWSPRGLANLRSKMAVALIDRELPETDLEADAYRTSALMDEPDPPSDKEGVEVTERDDVAALAAAYAALGAAAPTELETQTELGTRARRAASTESTS